MFRALFLASLVAPACGGSSDGGAGFSTPYAPGSGTIIGGNAGDAPTPSRASCLDQVCEGSVGQCGPNGAADVIVDDQGKVVDVVCYGQDVTVASVPTGQVASYTTDGNNAVLVLDGVNDGPDVLGDVTISGNNAVIYGSGPDTSVIGGTVVIAKNNAKIHGVRIQGDVTIDKNNTTLVYCVIEGNLTISGNNTTVAGCDVFGTVNVTGINTLFLRDRFSATDVLSGKHLTCNSDVSFGDANGNHVVEASEIGGPISCGS